MNDFIVSVAAIVNNDEEVLDSYIKETSSILSSHYNNFEIVLVDNGSIDQSTSIIKNIQCEVENIRLISLSKQYDNELARMAALDNCIGDYVILMDINYDPPCLIPEMVEKSQSGFELVIGERNNRDGDSFMEKLSANLFYKISEELTGYYINSNYSDFTCFSRKMVNSLVQIRDRSRYLKYLKLNVGFKQTSIKFDRIRRLNFKKKRYLLNTIGFALETIVTNSDKLLRWASLFGFLISFLNVVYMVYILIIAIVKRNVAPGWISSSLFSSMMFFFLFLILGIISIYISSVLKETKKGPLYYIFEESNSSVIYKNVTKRNIV